jgi:hypothetical protein
MKSPLLQFRVGVVLAMLLFGGRAFAQGCDQGILDYTTTCDTAPNGVVHAGRCSNFGSGGGPCEYCYQGSGVCVQSDGTHVPYDLANFGQDTSCSTCVGCCSGEQQCYGRTACDTLTCQCTSGSPVIIDTTGRGFHLTSAQQGVAFDIFADGSPIKISWTDASSGNAFLALDRNHNGKIDSGKELFGNVTEQAQSSDPNGFLALAEFDKPENGGNDDGIIDKRDAVFSHLLLWIDENHDGVSQPNELHSLPELGVYSIGLHYHDDRPFFDQYGNWFHYQAAVNPDPRDGKSKDGRVTYDVFFEVAHDQPAASISQSRVSRQDQWEGFLADDLALASLRARRTGCRPKPQQDNRGGTR